LDQGCFCVLETHDKVDDFQQRWRFSRETLNHAVARLEHQWHALVQAVDQRIASAQATSARAAEGDLEIEISVDRSELRLGENFQVQLTYRNRSDQTLYLLGPLGPEPVWNGWELAFDINASPSQGSTVSAIAPGASMSLSTTLQCKQQLQTISLMYSAMHAGFTSMHLDAYFASFPPPLDYEKTWQGMLQVELPVVVWS
jgi:hypothetical protein